MAQQQYYYPHPEPHPGPDVLHIHGPNESAQFHPDMLTVPQQRASYVTAGQTPSVYSGRSARSEYGSVMTSPAAPPSGAARYSALVPHTPYPGAHYDPNEKTPYLRRRSKRRKRAIGFFFALAIILAVVLAIVLPIYFTVIRKNGGGSSTGSTDEGPTGGGSVSGGTNGTDSGGHAIIVGTDGATVTTADGSTFTYNNPFGGYFIVDPNDPFNSGARAQSWSPALNETWTWGTDLIRGVNLGGWLVPEPFIVPALYQKYLNQTPLGQPGALTGDEWTLSIAMANDQAGGGLQQMADHYATFITEQDFAEIAGAGLNWIRLPMPFWALQTWDGEPFLEGVSWTYVLKAFEWARKYGLRVNLDLHTMPGAQNPWDHSGREGQVDWMNGTMGYANTQRGLMYIRAITEFITQPQYSNVVPLFGIVNEPTADLPALQTFYFEAHSVIRSITGIGAGHGPYISIHDQFLGPQAWAGFLQGSDRIALEEHPYFAFGGNNSPDIAPFITQSCQAWGPGLAQSQTAFGVTTAGEWSLGFNDCGLYINGVYDPHTTTDCNPTWEVWEDFTPQTKQQLMQFALAQMDTLQNWFFWTWKIGNDSFSGSVRSPLWTYQLGLQQGWLPPDPRAAVGFCAQAGVPVEPTFDGTYSAWQTGGAGAGTIVPQQSELFGTWPPTSMPGPGVPATLLPSYTDTAPILTAPTDSAIAPPSGTTVNGWFNTADTDGGITTIAGCNYPDPWNPGNAVPPLCPTVAAAVRREPEPLITPPPA